jgi:hypothetical protein
MDWFEKLTGFRETSYDDTRAKLKVDGNRLHSLINGASYAIGELELVSLQTLRERVKSSAGPHGRLKVNVATGDVGQMHQSPENAGALFITRRLASQRDTVRVELSLRRNVTFRRKLTARGRVDAYASS